MFRSAKLWLLFILIIIVVNSNLLILVSGLSEGEYLGKVIAGGADYPTYLAKMKIGYDGGWQYINRYTTEPHQPTYIFLFYILLGHMARVLELNLHLTYHAARFILAFIALKVLYDFIGKFSDEKKPLTILFLAVFISGSYFNSIDAAPQYHLYSGMMGFTHYMLTFVCLLKFFESVLDYAENKGKGQILKAVIFLNILAVIHPFMVVLAGLVITGTVLITKKITVTFPLLAVSAISSTPLMFYFFYIFSSNPVLIGWRAQAVSDIAPNFVFFLYGLGSLSAYFTTIFWAKGKIKMTASSTLFLVWFYTALFLSLTNLITSNHQWFFFACLPVAYLAYKFISYLENQVGFRVRIKGKSVITWLLLILLVLPSANILFLLDYRAVRMIADKDKYNSTFIPSEDMQCYEWLKSNAENNDIILAETGIGSLIPFVTNSYTFIGHHHETLDYKNKEEQVEKLLNNNFIDEEAINFLEINRIKYVIKNNKAETRYTFLEPVMTGKNITLYEFNTT